MRTKTSEIKNAVEDISTILVKREKIVTSKTLYLKRDRKWNRNNEADGELSVT